MQAPCRPSTWPGPGPPVTRGRSSPGQLWRQGGASPGAVQPPAGAATWTHAVSGRLILAEARQHPRPTGAVPGGGTPWQRYVLAMHRAPGAPYARQNAVQWAHTMASVANVGLQATAHVGGAVTVSAVATQRRSEQLGVFRPVGAACPLLDHPFFLRLRVGARRLALGSRRAEAVQSTPPPPPPWEYRASSTAGHGAPDLTRQSGPTACGPRTLSGG
jgi:hypothetical protein